MTNFTVCLTPDSLLVNKRELATRLKFAAAEFSIQSNDIARALANAIVAQAFFQAADELGVSGYLKGGSGQIWRFGFLGTRETRDVDLVLQSDRRDAEKIFDAMVGLTLGNFEIFQIKISGDRTSGKVPGDYRILVAKVQIRVDGSPWLTCDLEILPLETLSIVKKEHASVEVERLLTLAGLEGVCELPLISIALQLAEKLHALTEPGSTRAGDLYDIAFVLERVQVDLNLLKRETTRVFARRGTHSLDSGWSPHSELRLGFLGFSDLMTFEQSTLAVQGLLLKLGEGAGLPD